MTPLHIACRDAAESKIKELIAMGADLGATDAQGRTPLQLCEDKTDLVRRLIETLMRTLPDSQLSPPLLSCSRTLLHWACEHCEASAEALLSREVDVRARDSKGMTPLHLACAANRVAAAMALVWRGADIDARDASGMTPLHLACAAGHIATAEALVWMGASCEVGTSVRASVSGREFGPGARPINMLRDAALQSRLRQAADIAEGLRSARLDPVPTPVAASGPRTIDAVYIHAAPDGRVAIDRIDVDGGAAGGEWRVLCNSSSQMPAGGVIGPGAGRFESAAGGWLVVHRVGDRGVGVRRVMLRGCRASAITVVSGRSRARLVAAVGETVAVEAFAVTVQESAVAGVSE